MAYIIARIGIDEIVRTFSGVSYPILLAGFGLFFLNYFFRSLRFRQLVVFRNVKLLPMFKISCYYMALNYLLPARSGELSLPYLLKKREDIPVSQGVAVLVVARALDFLNVALFLPFVVILMWGGVGRQLLPATLGFFGLLAVCLSLLLLFTFRGETSLSVARKLLSALHVARFRVVEVLLDKLRDLQNSFRTIHFKNVYPRLFGLTVAIWLCVYAYVYLVITSFGTSITLLGAVLVVLFMVPTRLFPIQGVGNFGSHEVGWSAALLLLGLSHERALAVALSSHIVILVYILVLVVVAHIALR